MKNGETKEYNFIHYCLFVTFFPQLIAGPIVHHKEMMPQFENTQSRSYMAKNIYIGTCFFCVGLFKKLIIADGISPFANKVFMAADNGITMHFFDAWGGAFAYTAQLYFDFSGYADMAIGAALMFGIVLPINFNSPYKSTNIIDFWRRWHITLSRFLRDYIYIPLGGNRQGKFRKQTNLMATMLLGGLWHGAGWNFVIWGGLHGMYLVVNHIWRAATGTTISTLPKVFIKLYSAVAWAVTLLAVVIAWVFFRAETFAGAIQMLKGMFGINGLEIPYVWKPLLDRMSLSADSFIVTPYDYLINFGQNQGFLYIIVSMALAAFAKNSQEIMEKERRFEFLFPIYLAVIFSMSIICINRGSQFLYFQF